MQLIIFLYLLDNETSTVVLFSAGIGTLIEFWKVTKAMKVSIDWSTGVPLPKFEDKAGELAIAIPICSKQQPYETTHLWRKSSCSGQQSEL